MIRLHHCPETRSMRVLWLLQEMGVAFDIVVHSFGKALRDPDYLALSPAGRVPALEIEGAAEPESGAIVEHLCERFPEVGLGRAPGAAERADWLIWLHFAETVSQHSAALTQQHVVLYDDAVRSPVIMRIEARRLAKCYAAIDGRRRGRRHRLHGGAPATDIARARAEPRAVRADRGVARGAPARPAGPGRAVRREAAALLCAGLPRAVGGAGR